MKIKKLKIEDFRGIHEMSLNFPDNGTVVLVGVNGAGKSTILDCIAISLSALINEIYGPARIKRGIKQEDIQNGKQKTSIRLEISFLTKSYSVQVWKNIYKAQRKKIYVEGDIIDNIDDSLKDKLSELDVPITVLYNVNRAVFDVPLRIREKHEFDKFAAYDQALTGARNDFNIFFEWFRRREDIENEELRDLASNENFIREAKGKYKNDRQLNSVRIAIESFLPGFKNLRVRRKPSLRMTLDKDGKELIVNQLSDGEKCLLAMVGDLARRLAIANPSLSNPLEGKGIVLIDEIELHLHPQWQRKVIDSLERTFPYCQFIVTTHSPQVLSFVKKEQVFIIEDFRLVEKTPHTYGRDSNSILFDIMGVLERPEEIKLLLKECYRCIDEDRVSDAEMKINELESILGQNDQEVLRSKTILQFMVEK